MPDFQAHGPAFSEQAPIAQCAALTQYAFFSASGQDATSFLHGQLTNDVTALSATQARLAGFCTAKGRLLGTMVVYQPNALEEPCIRGFMRESLIEPVIKRLRMFVLRAKVKFDTPQARLHGVWTDARQVAALSQAAGGDLPTTPWQSVHLPTGTWICAPHEATTPRWWWIVEPAHAAQGQALSEALATREQSGWHQDDLHQGLPWIEAATQDLFIPQTVNLDLIGGVSFTKGCYPGQEIVARSHYLGKVKRRMTLGQLSDLTAGTSLLATDVFDAGSPGEPCGRVIDAATHGSDTSVLLETTLTAMAHPELRLGSADGPAITLKALPYALA